jgi:DNA-binding NarL/FixJ family response regulator
MAHPDSETLEAIEVVVVDDHPSARDWTASQLERCDGIRVIATAANGAETFRILSSMSPGCVVLDIRLPDCSGVDIARYLRLNQPRVAVVALTGYADPAYRTALARLGVHHFLSKSASGAEIETAVREAVAAIRRAPSVELPSVGGERPSAAPALASGRGRTGAVRVLVVEDHPVTAHGTRILLEQAGFQVLGVATSGAAGLELAERHQPDVVVLDLQLPDLSGVTVAQRMLQLQPRPSIVILTAQRGDGYTKALFRMGISGYLTKDAAARELVAAIVTVARGGVVTGRSLAEVQQPSALSQRERDILTLIAQGKTNLEIAETLHVSTKTVEYHLTGMFQRFDVRNRTELTHYAFSLGLI